MTSTSATERKLAAALMTASTLKDVEAILRMATKLYGKPSLRPVGDRPNNIGTIRLGSDPALGVVERVTNGMDDLLDLGHALHPSDSPHSPREAAELWYKVPPGGTADMTDSERRELGAKLKVWLDESGEDKRPTMVVEDDGLGQSPERFPKTLLSLNESNKVGQPWNMGTYGQGGAVTFGFSRATIVISRRHPEFLSGRSDRVGWTIVREYETDPALDILPSYKYVVSSPSHEVFELDPLLFPGFHHGTRIAHIGYDLQGWTGPFTTGLWQFLHAALFDPVLPFLVTGKRAKERDYGTRIVIGNAARLDRPDKARGDLEVAHKDSVKLDLGERHGSVTFNYWVVRRPVGSSITSDPAAGYVRPDSAISMTLFGQRQDAESRAWIKDNALLPFLYKNMVVQINSDDLTPIAKREIFASTRERATKSELRARIYQQLATVLRQDDELKRINYEEKERLLQRSTASSSEKVRKRLARFVKTRLKNVVKLGRAGHEDGTGSRKKSKSGGETSHRDTDDSHLHNVPTKLTFKRQRIRLFQGAGAYTWVELDAKNGYLPEHEDDLSFEWVGRDPQGKIRLVMQSMLLGGRSRWFFTADSDADLGEYEFRATLVTPMGLLSASTTFDVKPPPESKPKRKGREEETGPRVEWVIRDDWEEHEMNAHSVGYVTEDEDETIIWVNRHYVLLEHALSGRRLTPEAVETRATRYQLPVACALWFQHDDLKKTSPQPSEKYQRAERERMAEAVLVAIDPDVDVALEEGEIS